MAVTCPALYQKKISPTGGDFFIPLLILLKVSKSIETSVFSRIKSVSSLTLLHKSLYKLSINLINF